MAPGGTLEAQIVDQKFVPKAFAEILDLDHLVTQPRARRDENFMRFIALLVFLRIQFFEALQTCLAFRPPSFWVGAYPLQFGVNGALTGFFAAVLLLQASSFCSSQEE